MVVQRTKEKINQLREQPEAVRLQSVSRYVFIIGLAIAAVWLVILLPLQIALKRQPTPDEQVQAEMRAAEQVQPRPDISPAASAASLFAPTTQPSPSASPQP